MTKYQAKKSIIRLIIAVAIATPIITYALSDRETQIEQRIQPVGQVNTSDQPAPAAAGVPDLVAVARRESTRQSLGGHGPRMAHAFTAAHRELCRNAARHRQAL